MTELNNNEVQYSQQVLSNPLQQLIERLKPLHVMLAQNSYVKDTTRRLNRVIEDAENQAMILILGKERVGKTTLINGLLGRELLSASSSHPTSVNTFIRYGDEECIRAVFLDGIVATFDIGKIELLTTADNFGAQIIREHLDYLEVYIKHELLKEVTIVDSTALEVGADNSAYFSQGLIQRVDELFWVLRSGSIATEAELKFLTKLNKFGVKPHFIVNAIDCFDGNVASFIEAEKQRYGEQIESMLGVSAMQAIEARKSNDTQLLIDSHYTELTQLIRTITNNKEKKTRHIIERFINWLERLRKEIEIIPTREPYLSALESIQQYNSDTHFEFSTQQRDMAIIEAYEEEYRQISTVLKPVQTLYQLLQVLASELYLRDENIESFEQKAIRYQQLVREYRKLHSEYTQEYTRFEKQYKNKHNQSLENPMIISADDDYTKGRLLTLNKQQQLCTEKLEIIQKYEKQILESLYAMQNRLNELAMKQMKSILQQVGELNIQRKNEGIILKSSVHKLTEFNCIVEAQGFLRDAVLPYLVGDTMPLTEEEKNHVRNTIECICAVDLTHEGLYNRLSFGEKNDLTTQLEFESTYQLSGLSLTEADVISEVPALPEKIAIQEIL